MMPICGCAYRDRPYDDEPLPFAEALHNQIGAIEFFVAPTLNSRPVLQQASASYYGYVVVFAQRFLGFLLTFFYFYQMHGLRIYLLDTSVFLIFTITQKSKVGILVLVTQSKTGIPALHFKRVLRAETTFGDEHVVDLLCVSRDNQEVMSPCRHELICRRRCYSLRVVSF